MAASISAVAAICAKAPSITHGQNSAPGRGSGVPVTMRRPVMNTSTNGKPNRNRTCVAPTVPRLPVSARCVALRSVWAKAAMTVKTAQSQGVDITRSSPRPPCS